MKQGIYLDNNMTTRPSNEAISNMIPFLTERWGTPSAPHLIGQQLFPAMEEAYRSIYKLLDAIDSDTFVLTSSGPEAINHVLNAAYYDITLPTGKNQFITSNIEEAPALMAIGRLEQMGCLGKMVPADSNGQVTSAAIAEAFTSRTALVTLSCGNGLTGVIHPVTEIAAVCKERGVKLHLDITHILGKSYIDLQEIGADYITFNGDHLHAPKGTGGLYYRSGTTCSSFILGGLEQGGKRAGSVNVPGLVALGIAAQQALDSRDLICTETARLRDKLEQGIISEIPDATIFFKDQPRLPHTTTIGFPGLVNEALLFLLNRKNVYACIGGGSFQQIGLVLIASGVNEKLAHSAINFSLSRETVEDDIDQAIQIISQAAKHLRSLSDKLPSKGMA